MIYKWGGDLIAANFLRRGGGEGAVGIFTGGNFLGGKFWRVIFTWVAFIGGIFIGGYFQRGAIF